MGEPRGRNSQAPLQRLAVLHLRETAHVSGLFRLITGTRRDTDLLPEPRAAGDQSAQRLFLRQGRVPAYHLGRKRDGFIGVAQGDESHSRPPIQYLSGMRHLQARGREVQGLRTLERN